MANETFEVRQMTLSNGALVNVTIRIIKRADGTPIHAGIRGSARVDGIRLTEAEEREVQAWVFG